MSEGFSKKPLDGDDAADVRRMMHEWNEFSRDHKGILEQLAWVIKNWRKFAFVAVLGAAGAFTKLLEGLKAWW